MGATRLVPLAVLVGGLTTVVVCRPWVEGQVRTAIVLSAMADAPVLGWLTRVATADPLIEERVVAGMPTTVVRPEGTGPWPAIVFVNGATRRGRMHPDVQRLARGIARAGFVVAVPDLPGLRRGEITRRTVQAAVDVASATADERSSEDGRVSLMGVSVGTTIALLAAQRPALAERVRLVAGIAPYTGLREVIRLATTGYHRDRGRLLRYDARPYVEVSVARSLAAGLPRGPGREQLMKAFGSVDDEADDPLAVANRLPRNLAPPARDLVALLRNDDPRRFDTLYERLPQSMQAGVAELSPLIGAERIRARIELVSAPRDKYFPPEQSRALVRATKRSRLTVTKALSHVDLKLSFAAVGDLLRFDAFVVRTMEAAR